MTRYINIFLLFIKFNLSKDLMFRVNFYNSIFSTLIWAGFQFVVTLLITEKVNTVAGWNKEEMLLLTAGFNIVLGIFRALITRSLELFSYLVHYGKLDIYLLKPVDTQFWLSFQVSNIASFIRIPVSIIISLYLLSILNVQVSFLHYIMYFLLLLIGVVVLYSIWFMVITSVIWFSNLTNLKSFLDGLNGAARYPKEIFENTAVFFFIVFFPLSLVVSVPTKYLLRKAEIADVFLLVGTGIALLLFSRYFWKIALRSYTSAGG